MHTSNNDFCAPGEPTALHGTHLTLLNLKFLNFSFFCSFVTGSQNSLPGVQIRTPDWEFRSGCTNPIEFEFNLEPGMDQKSC